MTKDRSGHIVPIGYERDTYLWTDFAFWGGAIIAFIAVVTSDFPDRFN